MSSESASTRGSKDGGFFNLAGKLDTLSSPLDYIKRFFYQILGIYFPPVILMLYLILFWGNQQYLYSLDYGHIHGDVLVSPENNSKSLFVYAKTHDSIIQLILLVIVVAVSGEAINSVTSKLAKIIPIKRTNYFKKLNTKLGILRYPLGYPLSDPARLLIGPFGLT